MVALNLVLSALPLYKGRNILKQVCKNEGRLTQTSTHRSDLSRSIIIRSLKRKISVQYFI